ncbi:hypothetical protein KP79_PYT12254 [Mizuhopecten yessoensis]|uniref:Uncharacterized protein n=1 Tax=Mizuhopecten yessoensis TaxID=6573 RepID=A0A210QUL2_MIZYE|nr:hypothetical protein KP79_PYT12254 [Mizuhopecten yessoensis]
MQDVVEGIGHFVVKHVFLIQRRACYQHTRMDLASAHCMDDAERRILRKHHTKLLETLDTKFMIEGH